MVCAWRRACDVVVVVSVVVGGFVVAGFGRYDLTEELQYVEDLLEVVHVFSYEPYPSFPQASFLTGAVTESSVSVPQCASFADCSAAAHALVDTELLFPYAYVALDNMVGIYDDPVRRMRAWGGWVRGWVGW